MYVDLVKYIYESTSLPIQNRVPGERVLYAISHRGPRVLSAPPPDLLSVKLVRSCRKLALMWHAADQALLAEAAFYSNSVQEAPALTGPDAMAVYYHLESFVLFSRSALDIASYVFGWMLPAPFPNDRYDSFHRLLNALARHKEAFPEITPILASRDNPKGWVPILVGEERGRCLRDKLAHQTEFPIDYEDLPFTEKRHAVVRLSDQVCFALPEFLNVVRDGVLDGFHRLEKSVPRGSVHT